MIQGSSAIATPAKQAGLFGIHHMLSTKRRDIPGRHLFIDAYCGSGINQIGDEVVDGSPITILSAVAKSFLSFKEPAQYQPGFVFSDITEDRSLEALPKNIEAWQERNGFVIDRDHLAIDTRHGQVVAPILYVAEPADNLIARIHSHLSANKHTTVTLTIDPNGPKQIPYDQLQKLWQQFGRRMTLIFHISATTLKRVAGARYSAGFNFAPMPDHLSGLIEMFMENPRGWIRQPVGPDQWTIVMLTYYEPKHGWGKWFLKLTTHDGQEQLASLSLTNKQKKEAA